MKIVLIRPPKFMIEGTPVIPVIPPLGIALIAAVLKEADHQVTAIDAIAEAPGQFNKEDIPVLSKQVYAGYNLISISHLES